MARGKVKHCSPAERAQALTMLALEGSAKKAMVKLRKQGFDIHEQTLYHWKDAEPELWDRIRNETLDKVLGTVADESIALARQYAELEGQHIEKALTELDSLDARDRANMIRSVATARGISTDKAAGLHGRPTQVVEHRQAADIIRRLEHLGVIEGTAVEEDESPADVKGLPAGDPSAG